MNLTLDVQRASAEPLPDEDDLRRWIAATLTHCKQTRDSELCVRLVDVEEMSRLNENYRGRTGPTNVLSFPAGLPEELGLPLLGDIVICAPLVEAQARQQDKAPEAHWAHLAVHGTLHLLGYDHIEEDEAAAMETLETTILAGLGFPCPYRAAPEPRRARA